MILFTRAPYCMGDLKRDPDLDNHPFTKGLRKGKGGAPRQLKHVRRVRASAKGRKPPARRPQLTNLLDPKP